MYMYTFVTQTDSFTIWLALSPDPLKLVCELHTWPLNQAKKSFLLSVQRSSMQPRKWRWRRPGLSRYKNLYGIWYQHTKNDYYRQTNRWKDRQTVRQDLLCGLWAF